ncbi:hypothetical protein, partial [Gemella sp. zg-1178]|uniref:hypothetical protein n=1 Tax=Gemella sp. zg-1178 TaxID=2840372 RepID=UPI001C051323
LDDRTSEQCAVCSGNIYDIDKAPILPRHPRCRCVLVAYIDVDTLAKGFDREELNSRREEFKNDINNFWVKYDKLTEKTDKDNLVKYFKESYRIGKLPNLKPYKKIPNKYVDITGERLSYIFSKHYKEFSKKEFNLIYSLIENPDYIADNYSENSLLIYKKIPNKNKRIMEGVVVFDGNNTIIHFHKINIRKLKKLEKERKLQ